MAYGAVDGEPNLGLELEAELTVAMVLLQLAYVSKNMPNSVSAINTNSNI
jgi:hypothetical protein